MDAAAADDDDDEATRVVELDPRVCCDASVPGNARAACIILHACTIPHRAAIVIPTRGDMSQTDESDT